MKKRRKNCESIVEKNCVCTKLSLDDVCDKHNNRNANGEQKMLYIVYTDRV